MSPGRFQRIRDLVLEARELPLDERAAFLDRACAGDPGLRHEVEALLAHDSDEQGLLRSGGLLARVGASVPHALAADAPPERVGAYRIVRLLGEGGMGQVFLAEQLEPIQREVALKLVHRGLDSQRVLARFDHERRSLARMDHPGIARVLDAGSDESGRPYFVMEFVAGESLTDFTRHHGLGTRAKLDLLLRVCSAVHHAHQRSILHRDLKPSNILVAMHDGVPTPKIIDFGIAKALEASTDPFGGGGMTQEGQWLGTPDYMSPEQAGLVDASPDTRSDVYALGIILYELLAGVRPETPALAFLRRGERLETDSVVRPSVALRPPDGNATPGTVRGVAPGKLRREIAGDLDNIVLRSLRTEPSRRYPSVEHLADDLRRHLAGLPVLARPDTWRYRAGKFAKRHRLPLSLAAASVLALAGFAVMSVRQSARLAVERDRAREAERTARLEATTSRQVSDFLVGLFENADPNVARGEQISAREMLDRGAARLDSGLADQPEVKARLLQTVGTVYQVLGSYESAQAALEKALALRRAALGDSAADVASTLDALGAVAHDQSRLEDAERLHREAVAIWRRALPPDHEDLVAGLSNLATTLQARGNYEEAASLKREALASGRRAYGPQHAEVGFLLYSLGYLEHRLGHFALAESLYLAALAIQRHALGSTHPDVAGTLNNLAAARGELGDVAGSEPLWREALALHVALYGPDHPSVARAKANLARCLLDQGRAAEALPLFEEARALSERLLGTEHRNYATPIMGLGRTELALGHAERAEAFFRQALAIRRKALGPEGPGVGTSLAALAAAVARRGDVRQAESLLRESLRIQRAHLPPTHPDIGECLVDLGELLLRSGRAREARPLLEEAVRIRRDALPAGHPAIAKAEAALEAVRRAPGGG